MSSYKGYGTLSAHQKPTVGDTKMSVASIDHMGWLLCDGRSLNVKDFYFLFSMIQYSFGGSGGVFNLPNPAGRVAGVIGQPIINNVPGVNHQLGDISGEQRHQLTMDEMPKHDHFTGQNNFGDSTNYEVSQQNYTTRTALTVVDPGHSHTTQDAYFSGNPGNTGPSGFSGTGATQDNDNSLYVRTVTSNTSTTGITVRGPDVTPTAHRHQVILPYAGESQAHNNLQPTLFMGNMFIYSGKPNFGTVPYSLSYPYMPVTPTTTATPYSSRTLIL